MSNIVNSKCGKNMSIDIKNLIIGSHVLVDGKRVRIFGIERSGLIELKAVDGDLLRVLINDVESIEITAELLEELGFKTKNQKYNTKCWRRTEIPQEGRRLPSIEFITFWLYRNGYCKIHYRMDFMDINVIVCRYLHEAEAFLALHGVELIKD